MTVVLDDGQSEVDLRENEPMIRETASLLGIQVQFTDDQSGVSVTFYR
ncbi:MAG: hypothetical protein AAF601_03615 [Pseudomonadota bacterium]